jgi:hypothetical protein
MRALVGLFFTFSWIAGIVIANGFWSTLFAIFIPFWAFYLDVELLLVHFHLLG